jgi:N4-gp56 family major capsid protein
MANEIVYGTGADSSVGSQVRTDYYYKAALVEAAKEAYFSQMADVRAMPKNMGKTIKQFHYLPILDDRNLNSQGIDAVGALASAGVAGTVNTLPYIAMVSVLPKGQPESQTMYFRADNATGDTQALAEAKAKFVAWAYSKGFLTTVDIDSTATAADIAAAYVELVDGSADAVSADGAGSTAGATPYVVNTIAGSALTPYGNLYGSSKDIGTITSKIPALSETGGRVNRVGMKRIELEGTLEKFGFFTEYTKESMDFDSDDGLQMHLTKEVVKAANELTEDQIQMDLLNGAGVVRYTGTATSAATLQGNDIASPFASDNTNDALTYDDLVKLGIELDNNRCPKNTTLIAGSRMVDTKVVNAARYIYIGSELLPTIMRLTDYHGNKAFIPAAQYASAGNVAKGEVGAIDTFRFIVVPEMMHWAAAGAAVGDANEEGAVYRYSATADGAALKFNVYPMLVVGEGSFTTIGFQTDGKSVKFVTKHVAPEQNHTTQDPYGETGFHSIKWYYGLMVLRPERIAVIKTIAELG